jgi:hypothetical protein
MTDQSRARLTFGWHTACIRAGGRRYAMSILYIIGAIVVIFVVLRVLGIV